MGNQYQSNQPELTTGEYFQLYDLLNKLRVSGKIQLTEMEDLLLKSGLIKIESNKYEDPSGSILLIVKQ